MTPLNILALSGSLRAKSYNHMALEATRALLPAGVSMAIHDYADIPLYNQDVQDRGFPASVERLRAAVAAADGVLICSPEYNFSVAGVLKNAIDWLSRTTPQPFKGKPVAIMSATQGPLGGARSQYELRKILGSIDALVLVKPEVFMGFVQNRFDAQGQLTDAATVKIITDQMLAFQQWMLRLRATAG
jgi:chromate reductase, NAD(P)H dehydrogenase (quinone)